MTLLLPGVDHDPEFANPFDAIADERAREAIESPPLEDTETITQKIPKMFKSLADWSTESELRCWSCTLNFSGAPRFIPSSIDPKTDRVFSMAVDGNFCTFNCAARYIEDRMPREKRWGAHANLLFLYRIFTDKSVVKIKPSPRFSAMTMYGGDMSVDEYRAAVLALDPEHGGLRSLARVIPDRERESAPPAPRPSAPTMSLWDICCGPLGVGGTEAADVSAADGSPADASAADEQTSATMTASTDEQTSATMTASTDEPTSAVSRGKEEVCDDVRNNHADQRDTEDECIDAGEAYLRELLAGLSDD